MSTERKKKELDKLIKQSEKKVRVINITKNTCLDIILIILSSIALIFTIASFITQLLTFFLLYSSTKPELTCPYYISIIYDNATIIHLDNVPPVYCYTLFGVTAFNLCLLMVMLILFTISSFIRRRLVFMESSTTILGVFLFILSLAVSIFLVVGVNLTCQSLAQVNNGSCSDLHGIRIEHLFRQPPVTNWIATLMLFILEVSLLTRTLVYIIMMRHRCPCSKRART